MRLLGIVLLTLLGLFAVMLLPDIPLPARINAWLRVTPEVIFGALFLLSALLALWSARWLPPGPHRSQTLWSGAFLVSIGLSWTLRTSAPWARYGADALVPLYLLRTLCTEWSKSGWTTRVISIIVWSAMMAHPLVKAFSVNLPDWLERDAFLTMALGVVL